MEKVVRTLKEFEEEACSFAQSLRPRAKGAVLVTLSGELGAGKTAFVKAMARELGVSENVHSPTFVLEKVYTLPEGGHFKRLVHLDAYRLERGAELAPLGFGELLRNTDNLVLLEWPERVQDALPEPFARLSLTLEPDGSRLLSYTYAAA